MNFHGYAPVASYWRFHATPFVASAIYVTTSPNWGLVGSAVTIGGVEP
jgi:hypothetical protein